MVSLSWFGGSKHNHFPGNKSDTDYDVYARCMVNRGHGLSLWQPFPPETQEGLLHHVMIGHVGYINQGKFNFIFDAAQPLGPSRVRGKDVPDDFNFLEGLGQARRSPATCYDRDPCTEHWGFKYVSGLSAKAEARKQPGILPISASTSLSLHTTKDQGAFLRTHGVTKVVNARSPTSKVFEGPMKAHYKSWIRFGLEHGHDVDRDNLFFVTGADLADEYDVFAYSKPSSKKSASVSVGVLVGKTSISWSRSLKVAGNCWLQSSKDVTYTPALDDTSNSGPRSSVFIRGWRIRARLWPEHLNGAAGPHNLGGAPAPSRPGSPCGEQNDGILSTPDSTESESSVDAVPVPDVSMARFRDPLQPLFDYIFEKSNATLAMVHDDHYRALLDRNPDMRDRTVEEVVQHTQPEIEVDEDGVGTLKEYPDSAVIASDDVPSADEGRGPAPQTALSTSTLGPKKVDDAPATDEPRPSAGPKSSPFAGTSRPFFAAGAQSMAATSWPSRRLSDTEKEAAKLVAESQDLLKKISPMLDEATVVRLQRRIHQVLDMFISLDDKTPGILSLVRITYRRIIYPRRLQSRAQALLWDIQFIQKLREFNQPQERPSSEEPTAFATGPSSETRMKTQSWNPELSFPEMEIVEHGDRAGRRSPTSSEDVRDAIVQVQDMHSK